MYEKPAARFQHGATDSEAIRICAGWMRFLGAVDTVEADPGASIPCDLYSRLYLGWVDNRSPNVGFELVDRAIRVSDADGRIGLIFFRYGFNGWASEKATEYGIAVLRFSPGSGSINGLNRVGREICSRGLD
jgi:hypothetical protein